MSDAPSSIPTHSTDPHRAVLDDLITLGQELAHLLMAQARTAAATPTPDTPTLPDLADAFDRVTRAVRRSVLLARTLDTPPKPTQSAPPAHLTERVAARRQIIRAVEDGVNNAAGGADAEILHAELRDRLDRPELDTDIATRPVPDIIEDIRRDLGLSTVLGPRAFKRRTPAEIAILHARAAAPPGAAAAPHLAITFPPRPANYDDTEHDFNQHLALMLANAKPARR